MSCVSPESGLGSSFPPRWCCYRRPRQSAYELVGDWAMEESSGATLMLDSSGHALHGQIGPDVVTGETTGPGTKGYRFKGDWWVVNDDRLVQFPDNPSPRPRHRHLRGRPSGSRPAPTTPTSSRRVSRRPRAACGSSSSRRAWPRCHFRDTNHNTAAIGFVNSPDPETKVDDNTWHVIRCERTLTGVRVSIDREHRPSARSSSARPSATSTTTSR